MKTVYILGINESHVATAALLKDGEIIACASEERFTRKKGQWGFPENAINYCLQEANISSREIDGVFLGFNNPTIFINDTKEKASVQIRIFKKISPSVNRILQMLIGFIPFTYVVYEFLEKMIFYVPFIYLKRKHLMQIARELKISESKIQTIDHHYAHAFASYYSNPRLDDMRKKTSLVVTNDGLGDEECSCVFKVENDVWQKIASTPNKYSLGWLYLFVTEYLGMKPNEHEYKVMGLAPYSRQESADNVYKIFKKLMWVDGLTIKSTIPMMGYPNYISKKLAKTRFDSIAGGIQKFTEKIITKLIQNSINMTKVHTVILGGGVFMNVKVNLEIMNLKNLKDMFVMPSSGDESTAIGAAYYGYKKYCEKNKLKFISKPLSTLYLGPKFNDREIKETINKFIKKNKNIKLMRVPNPEEKVAQLLAEGNVVARFSDKMEYGARALGNRSILAPSNNFNIIRVINEKIKGRDFWMPFAPVILKERADEYLINKKKIDSPFMMIAFNTTEKAKKDFAACIHPYDYTARPQILSEQENPSYYKLIKKYSEITGIGGLLNTSFNIHGEPVVCSPLDALSTFNHSGLNFLQIENYILEKVSDGN